MELCGTGCLMAALIDTGFLLAVIDADDKWHSACTAVLLQEVHPLLPDVVLPELAYMLLRSRQYTALSRFLRSITAGELHTASVTIRDLNRVAALLEKYADSRVDYVDCAIVALAERLNITRILTIDQRHFRLFKPNHCEGFDIQP
jgi:predicted nucleic acid-binding protein